MNPYNAPESELLPQRGNLPVYLKVVLALLVVAGLADFVNTVLMFGFSGVFSFDDPALAFFNIVWLLILFWLANSVNRGTDNPKLTFLILAVISLAAAFGNINDWLLMLSGLIESACFGASFLILRSPAVSHWFGSPDRLQSGS